MENGFERIWTSDYSHIWCYGECEQILNMPNMLDYGLSPQVIKEYERKKYELDSKRQIKVGNSEFKIDEFVGMVCLLLGVCGVGSLFFASFMHPFLAAICGIGVLFGIYYLTKFIVSKLDERDYKALKIDIIEKYLQDYREWNIKVEKAKYEASKTRERELLAASSNDYWKIIKEVMDSMQ